MKKPKTPGVVTLAIFTTITVIFWIFFEVYETLSSAPTVDVPENLLEPINPTLDTNALQNLESRAFFEEGDVTNVRFSTVPQQQPTTPEDAEPETEEQENATENLPEDTSVPGSE